MGAAFTEEVDVEAGGARRQPLGPPEADIDETVLRVIRPHESLNDERLPGPGDTHAD